MAAFLIIPLLISGYIVLTTHPYHFYRLHRYDGQLLYMKAAVYGFFCVAIVILMAIIIKALTSNFHPVTKISEWAAFTKDEAANRRYSWLIIVSSLSVFTGALWGYGAKAWYLLRFIRDLQKGRYQCEIKDIFNYLRLATLAPLFAELPIDRMIFESMVRRKGVLVSLKCGKVYVGVINKLSEPNESEAPNQEISLVPTMSGYRHKDTRRVVILNDYAELKDVDTSIAIPSDEISHISWFTHDVHQKIDNNADKERTSIS